MLAVATLATVVAACGSSSADDPDEPPIGPAVIQRYAGLEYDAADVALCGDTITIEEAIFYPMPEDAVAEIDRDWYHASADPASAIASAPDGAGNGGEPGTLIVFADGVAEFIADSGTVTWFTLLEPEIEPGTEPDCP